MMENFVGQYDLPNPDGATLIGPAVSQLRNTSRMVFGKKKRWYIVDDEVLLHDWEGASESH